ncbi:hypothetical protein HHI36_009155 [Cryptolaemus montrouzieri]|uniref:Uncharacterized protein n=1 Tax=Cryptolaemus montrouzieri TaxID=559131 RepID=A0ABD2MVB2_9CUCU
MVSKTPRPTTAELEGRKDEFKKNHSVKLTQINQFIDLNEMCNIITDALITSTKKYVVEGGFKIHSNASSYRKETEHKQGVSRVRGAKQDYKEGNR